MTFPVFRKYQNGKSYFKINSFTSFEEIKTIGKYYSINSMSIKTLPERNFLMDMLENQDPYWVSIQEEEYNQVKEFLEKNYTPLHV